MSSMRRLPVCFPVLLILALRACLACSETDTAPSDGDLDADTEADGIPDGDDSDGDRDALPDGDLDSDGKPEADIWDGQSAYVREFTNFTPQPDDVFSQWRVNRFMLYGTSECLDDIRALAPTRDDLGEGLIVTQNGVCAWRRQATDNSPAGQLVAQQVYAGYEDETAFVAAVWTGQKLIAATANMLHVYDPQTEQWTRANMAGNRSVQTLHYSDILEADTVYVGTQQGAIVYHPSFGFGARLIASDRDVRAMAVTQNGLYLGTTTGLLLVSDGGDSQWDDQNGLPHVQVNALAVEGGDSPRLWIGTSGGLAILTGQQVQALPEAWLPLPYSDIRALSYSAQQKAMFVGAHGGVFVRTADSWQVFGAPRYAWGDSITDLLADDAGLWIASSSGLTRLWTVDTTLEAKSRQALNDIATRHRDGASVRDVHFSSRLPGDYNATTFIPSSQDLMNTALFAAARCGEFSADQTSGRMDQAAESLDELLALETVTDTPGYLANLRLAYKPADASEENGWRKTDDGQWWRDAFDLYDLSAVVFLSVFWKAACDNQIDTARLKDLVVRMAENALENVHRLTGPFDTRPLDLSPDYLSGEGAQDKPGLRALAALTLYSLAYVHSADRRFDEARIELARDHGYLTLLADQARSGEGRPYAERWDAAALFFAYAWASVERGAVWQEQIDAALTKQADLKDPERLPLAILLKAAVLGAPLDGAGLMAALRDWQPDPVGFEVRADLREDVRGYTPPNYPGDPDFGLRMDGRCLPSSERPLETAFTLNAYELSGGEHARGYATVMWPLYYWFGRVYGMIDPPQDSAP
jgi:hypothetical protein